MRACDRNRGFIAERNYHTDLSWNHENFKRLAALPRCHRWLGMLPRCTEGSPLCRGVLRACSALPARWVPAEAPAAMPQPLPPARVLLGAGGGGAQGSTAGVRGPLGARELGRQLRAVSAAAEPGCGVRHPARANAAPGPAALPGSAAAQRGRFILEKPSEGASAGTCAAGRQDGSGAGRCWLLCKTLRHVSNPGRRGLPAARPSPGFNN